MTVETDSEVRTKKEAQIPTESVLVQWCGKLAPQENARDVKYPSSEHFIILCTGLEKSPGRPLLIYN